MLKTVRRSVAELLYRQVIYIYKLNIEMEIYFMDFCSLKKVIKRPKLSRHICLTLDIAHYTLFNKVFIAGTCPQSPTCSTARQRAQARWGIEWKYDDNDKTNDNEECNNDALIWVICNIDNDEYNYNDNDEVIISRDASPPSWRSPREWRISGQF